MPKELKVLEEINSCGEIKIPLDNIRQVPESMFKELKEGFEINRDFEFEFSFLKYHILPIQKGEIKPESNFFFLLKIL